MNLNLNPLNWIRQHAFNRQRAIFKFWDGRRWRAVDPFMVFRKLDDHPTFNWSEHPLLIDVGDTDAIGITVNAIREVFGVPAFDDSGTVPIGLTEPELIDLLIQFNEFLGAAKKNISPQPISPPSSESPDSDRSTITVDSESGSTSIEPKPDEPSPSFAPSSEPSPAVPTPG